MKMIDRYIYAVVRHLPDEQSGDIEKELRSVIEDMAGERFGGQEPSDEQIETLLRELGDPRKLAMEYRDEKSYLIGPALYEKYLQSLQSCIASSIFGAGLFVAWTYALNPAEDLARVCIRFLMWGIAAVCASFFIVTAVFALIERCCSNHTKRRAWKPSDLPKVPRWDRRVSICGFVFSVIIGTVMCLVVVLGNRVIRISSGTELINPISVQIFTLEGMRVAAPVLVSLQFVGIIKEMVKFVAGKWTLKLAVIDVIVNSLAIFCYVFFMTRPGMFNQEVLGNLFLKMFPKTGAETVEEAYCLSINIFVYCMVVVYVLGSGAALLHGIRYRYFNKGDFRQEG